MYGQLLNIARQTALGLDVNEFNRIAFISSEDKLADFEKEFPGFDGFFSQGDGDLGERMMTALRLLLLLADVDKAILIGSDCPELACATINEARILLGENDVVLGPTEDGGYYLIGMNKVDPELFTGIKWSGATVFEDSMTKAHVLGLRVGCLPQLRDLDDAHDLDYYVKLGMVTAASDLTIEGDGTEQS